MRLQPLRREQHAIFSPNLVVHRANRPRATKKKNAELAKADSAFCVCRRTAEYPEYGIAVASSSSAAQPP